MTRLRDDVALASVPHLLEPLLGLLSERRLAEIGDYYFRVQVATIGALLLELDKQRPWLHHLVPSEN
jgi:hypothetical protein